MRTRWSGKEPLKVLPSAFYAASLSDGEVGNEADQPTVSDAVLNEPAEIPACTVALFYRASCGSDTQNLTMLLTDSWG